MDDSTHNVEQDPSHEDAFPLGFPTALEARKSLLEDLQKWRKASDVHAAATLSLEMKCGQPKRPTFFERQATPWSACRERCQCVHFAWPEPRPRPPIFDVDLVGCELKLVKRIQRLEPPENYRAQLYDATIARDTTDTPTSVIAKVYQASLSRRVAYLAHVDYEESIEVALPFRREKWAYERMKHYEGTAIPHIAGFFQTTLPHGEPVVVLIMERVHSLLENYISKPWSPTPPILDGMPEADMLRAIVYGMAATTHAMWSCGVMQLDMAGPNYLWPTFGIDLLSTPCIPVAVDFVQTITSDDDEDWKAYHSLHSTLKVFTEYQITGSKLADALVGLLETDSKIKMAFQLPNKGEIGYFDWEASLERLRQTQVEYQ